jgi:hypothetical protein
MVGLVATRWLLLAAACLVELGARMRALRA